MNCWDSSCTDCKGSCPPPSSAQHSVNIKTMRTLPVQWWRRWDLTPPLTDRWMLRRDDGDLQVRIVEASPSQVVVQNDDYGSGMDLNVRFTLETPTSDQLRRS